MMSRCVHIAILLLMALPCLSQTKNPADLSGAVPININQEYSFDQSPTGYGAVKEFTTAVGRSPIYFKEERNTRWFLIEIPYSGILTFELTPMSIKDDYDWMLFKYTPQLPDEIATETARPVRTNNSRNDPSVQSKTGIKEPSEVLFTRPGPNPSFCKPVEASKGEKYALVVDNIYQNGSGFMIRVTLEPTFPGPFVMVEGMVRDKRTLKPLKAEILFEDDSTAFPIARVFSDSSGYYRALLPVNRPINGVADNPSYLFATNDFILKDTVNQNLDFSLDTISRGKKLVLFNVHFQPNKDLIVPKALPELQRLTDFLKREEKWSVRIVGHTNNNVFADSRYLQQLSFNRAVAVKRYLIRNGVSEKRLSCTGLGGKTPFIKTKDLEEGLKNLRVEIILEQKH